MPRQEMLVRLVGMEQTGVGRSQSGMPALAGMLTKWTRGFYNKLTNQPTKYFRLCSRCFVTGKELEKKGNGVYAMKGGGENNMEESIYHRVSSFIYSITQQA